MIAQVYWCGATVEAGPGPGTPDQALVTPVAPSAVSPAG